MEEKKIKLTIPVTEDLITMANLWAKNNATLFIVGGYVRNSVMKISGGDVDIASYLEPDVVINLSTNLGYRAQIVNKHLGTVLITTPLAQYEYTTYRADNYDTTGTHAPCSSEFVTSQNQDASRRDFTCNALYYDILNETITDYFNGITDIKNKKLVVINNEVFNSDGVRLLRFVRFLGELGFKPNKNSLSLAKQNASKLKQISSERILKELKLIVVADKKYGYQNSHRKALFYMNKLKLWQYIFNSNFQNFKIKSNGPLFQTFKTCENQFRYLAFIMLVFHSFLKGKTSLQNIEFLVSVLFGNTTLKESNTNTSNIYNCYCMLNYLLYENKITYELGVRFHSLTGLVQEYIKLVPHKNVTKLLIVLDEMSKKNIPVRESDLKLDNNKLIQAGIDNKLISKIRLILLQDCVHENVKNNEELLMKEAFIVQEMLKIHNKK